MGSSDDLDLIHLFGLSQEEALGLGLTDNAVKAGRDAPDGEPEVPPSPAAISAIPLTASATHAEPKRASAAGGREASDGGSVPDHAPIGGLPVAMAFPTMRLHAFTPLEAKTAEHDVAPAGVVEGAAAPPEALALPPRDAIPVMGQEDQAGEMQQAETRASPIPEEPVSGWMRPGQVVAETDDAQTEGSPLGAQGVAPELLDAYAQECAELLDGLHVELEHLESDFEDHGALLETRRIIHTIKGGAKLCGFEHVAAFTHACENLLDLIADGQTTLNVRTLQALFDAEPLLRSSIQEAIAGHIQGLDGLLALASRFDELCAAVPPVAEDAELSHALVSEPFEDEDGAGLGAAQDIPAGANDMAVLEAVHPAAIQDIPAGEHSTVAVATTPPRGATETNESDIPAAMVAPPHAVHDMPAGENDTSAVAAAPEPVEAMAVAGHDVPGAADIVAAPLGGVSGVSDTVADTPLTLRTVADPVTTGGDGQDKAPDLGPAPAQKAPTAALTESTLSPYYRPGLQRLVRAAREAELQTAPISQPQRPAEAPNRPAARRGANSITVDLGKVDTVVAKITEMAAHRVSSQGMLSSLLSITEDARRNVARLHSLVMQLGNECAGFQPEEASGDDELNLETYSVLNMLVLQMQEAISDQQGLVQSIYDTITSHWSLQALEARADADIQSALMSIRLVPISNMRVRLDGVVRQAAEESGKQVRLHLQGGSVSIEKSVFDKLFEPLMHLLRNAVDHGIESPAVRRAEGKPEAGTIIVGAAQDGNQIVLTVSDDGAGIIPNKIAAKAMERGLITAAEANTMTQQQKMGLIFLPGFSTAESVSHLSGRGVGMDAVREACLRMGGSIEVSSRPAMGTTFTLRLPLSLSLTRGLIIRDGGCVMVFPVSQIMALHLVAASDIVDTPRGRVARLEGQELPIYNLPPLPGSRTPTYMQNGEVDVLQVGYESGSIGLLIEQVLGEEEILIKAPPAILQGVKALLGAHVMNDGTVAPVVNLPQLLTDLRQVTTLVSSSEQETNSELTALVVDDSMSMRLALTGTLQSAGFKVLTARDGQEALEVIKRDGVPSLITLDVEMPRMDGLETLYAIRHMNGASEVPIFMMTSRGGSKHRRAAEQLGATRYFTKPYRDSDLAVAARDACSHAIIAS